MPNNKPSNLPFWQGKRVVVTGHTGFKGAWMCLMLHRLGARVYGYALAPDTPQALWPSLAMPGIASTIGDILDSDGLHREMQETSPDIVIHLAAQSLVRRAHAEPAKTFAVNVQGTVNLLCALRDQTATQAIVVATTDKCYRNNEWVWPYRETDPLGGDEPYGASKACTELAVNALRATYFNDMRAGIATVRAGNVVGGGDWSTDRLIPDLVRGAITGTPIHIRNPRALRPWQHVLDANMAYLQLAQGLYEAQSTGRRELSKGWNVGPTETSSLRVGDIVEMVKTQWHDPVTVLSDPVLDRPAESVQLEVDSRAFRVQLNWSPKLTQTEAIRWAIDWYAKAHRGVPPCEICEQQLEEWLDL